jgi:hypothetical protein
MNVTRMSKRPKGMKGRLSPKQFDELVEGLDIERQDPHSQVFAHFISLQICYADWFVIRLLKRAARFPALTREEKLVISMGGFAIPELVRIYLDPDPILDQTRLTDVFLGITENVSALPEDAPRLMKSSILRSVPEKDHDRLTGLLNRIATHKFDNPWANWKPVPCNTRPPLTP